MKKLFVCEDSTNVYAGVSHGVHTGLFRCCLLVCSMFLVLLVVCSVVIQWIFLFFLNYL